MRVVVLCGGESPEREVSLASGRSVASALLESGYEVTVVDPAAEVPVLAGPLRAGDAGGALGAAVVGKEPPSPAERPLLRRRMHAALTGGPVLELLRGTELVFVALHGGWGEDGHVQGLLEMAGVPFTGAGSAACAAAWHKGRAQAVVGAAGVPVAERVLWRAGDVTGTPGASDVPEEARRLVAAGPVVAKPVADGSSVSVRRVDSLPELVAAAAEVHAGERHAGRGHAGRGLVRGGELLIEPFLPGREFTVAVIGDQALPVVEIELTSPVFDYAAKYQPGAVSEVCPARVPADVAARLQEWALRTHRALGFGEDTYSRTDFRCDADGQPVCLELNALPGLTPESLVPRAATGTGWSYAELIRRIVALTEH
ncbi:D-alanine--D-alanine ligase family protein [Streptomyces sp. G45]|uniref:D-alanine--D-alanine ligase family protein n=1 Tax=Streptomyces sp. G45 TaxID=3406627 RepID=UPI003C2840E1